MDQVGSIGLHEARNVEIDFGNPFVSCVFVHLLERRSSN